MRISQEIGSVSLLVNCLQNLGSVYQSLSEPLKAIDYYTRALPLSRQLGNRATEARLLNGLGAAYVEIREYQAALDSFLPSLRLRRVLGDRRLVASSLNNLAVVEHLLGRISESVESLNEALPLWRTAGDPAGEGATLLGLARAQHASGEYRRAFEYANAAMTAHKSIGNKTGEGAVLLLMARLNRESADRVGAQRDASAALDLCRSIKTPKCQAVALTELGMVATELHEWDRAADYFEESLAIHRATLDADGEALVTLELARLERLRGRLDAAREHAERALVLVESQWTRVASVELRASWLATRHEAYRGVDGRPHAAARPGAVSRVRRPRLRNGRARQGSGPRRIARELGSGHPGGRGPRARGGRTEARAPPQWY